MKKRLLSILLALCMVLTLLPGTVWAAETSGTCGINLTWSYSNGTLTVEGTGSMYDYKLNPKDNRPAPWYDHCEEILTVKIGNAVTSIGEFAFNSCSNLISITIPDSVTTIGLAAFGGCTSLISITIPGSVTSIGRNAFSGCSSLTNVTIPDRVTTIEYGAFSGCSGLTNVTIPDSVTSIEEMAFQDCTSLTSVTIPDSVIGIGSWAFQDCTSLTSVTIPDSVTSIGQYAFWGCSSMTSVTIGNGIIYIGNYAFLGCSSLTKATISVNAAEYGCGYYAFDSCTNLTDVYYGGSESQWKQAKDRIASSKNDPLLNATIHYNSKGPGDSSPSPSPSDPTPSGSGTYTELSPANGTAGFGKDAPDQVGVAVDQFAMSFDRPLKVTHNQPVLDFSKGTIALHSSDGKVLWEAKTYNSDNTCTDIVVMGSTDNKAFAIRPINLQTGALLDYDSTYYITVDPGVIQFADGSVMDGIKAGEWQFSTILQLSFSIQAPFKSKAGSTFNYYGPFYDKNASSVGTNTYSYDEVWFNKDSTIYQHDLTRMSMRMALAAYGDGKGQGDDYSIRNSANKNIWNLMEDLGFENITAHYPIPDRHSIGYIIGAKNIRTDDGTEYSLINVSIRGGGYGAEWGGNFQVGTDTEHEGWMKARGEVIRGIEKYMEEYGASLFPTQKVWIQGYSRAGAVTNLVAKELDLGTVKGVTAAKRNIYAFCFEAPQGTRAGDKDGFFYDNIVSIANPIDIVTKVVPSGLGKYGRYGKTYYLPYNPGTENYKNLEGAMLKELRKIANETGKSSEVDDKNISRFNISSGMAVSLDDLMDDLSTFLKGSPEEYVNSLQGPLVPLAEKLLGKGSASVSIKTVLDGFFSAGPLVSHYSPTEPIVGGVTNIVNFNKKSYVILNEATQHLMHTGFTFHYPELCMAWLDSLEGEYDYCDPVYGRIFINCPVNVKVYDSEGKLVGEIVDGEVIDQENSSIYAYIDANDQMVLAMPTDEEYRIEMTATDDGTVTYTATEYNMDTASTDRVVGYYEVEVEKDDVLIGIAENLDDGLAKYPLALNGDALKSDIDQSGDAVAEHTITVSVSGNGEAGGSGIYVSGEFAKVIAEPDSGEEFLGWYVDDTLVSEELEYRFLVDGNIGDNYEITARFTTNTIRFTDVVKGEYYYDAVLWAVANDITAGTSSTTFSPNNPCTRAQIVTFLWRAAGSPAVTVSNKFTDVKAGEYYTDAVAWAVANGITSGTSATTFSPDKECTRAEAVTFLYRAKNSPTVSGTNSFTDLTSGAYYINAVQWAANTGVTSGTSGTTFSPDQTCTRAQIVTFLYRDRES